MPRKKPLHTYVERGRYVFRVGHGPRTRLPGKPGDPDFLAAYAACLAGEPLPGTPARQDTRSLAWLVGQWMRSADWAQMSAQTRRQRGNILARVLDQSGSAQYRAITARDIARGRDRRAATPAAANNFLKAMRGLFRWARESGLIAVDPTNGVRSLRNATMGHRPWTQGDVDRYRARWPLGTRERVALEVLICTGARRGDAAVLGPQHVRGGLIHWRMEKTRSTVTIPLLPELAEAVAAGPTGDLCWIATVDGRPFAKESFANWFRRACTAAGVTAPMHGTRKYAATRLADEGATAAQLMAWFGWSSLKIADIYTRSADRARMAEAAGELLTRSTDPERGNPTSRSRRGI